MWSPISKARGAACTTQPSSPWQPQPQPQPPPSHGLQLPWQSFDQLLLLDVEVRTVFEVDELKLADAAVALQDFLEGQSVREDFLLGRPFEDAVSAYDAEPLREV